MVCIHVYSLLDRGVRAELWYSSGGTEVDKVLRSHIVEIASMTVFFEKGC